MQYITEFDLKVIEKNTFKVPRFLLGDYKKISADSKLLFALMMDHQTFVLDDLVTESGYSPKLIRKCTKELSKAGLIQVDGTLLSINQLRRTV